MSIDGLWTIQLSETEEFYDQMQVGQQINRGGNLVLTNGQVLGGGMSYYYTGHYTSSGNTVSLQVTCTRYNDLTDGVFGDYDEATFSLSGTIDDEKMTLHGFLEEDKNKMIFIKAIKQADIFS